MQTSSSYQAPRSSCEWCGTAPITWTITDRFGHRLGAGCCRSCLSGAIKSLVPVSGKLTVRDLPSEVSR